MNLLKEPTECRYCFNNCDLEHSDYEQEPELFVDICDNCLSDKLAEKELKEDLKEQKQK